MSKTLVDTNILLRLILRDDPKGLNTAEALLASAESDSCRVTVLVASEVVYVLHVMGYPRERISASLAALLALSQFDVEEHILGTIELFQRHKLDFVDCYLIQVALHDGQTLVTLDKKAARLYAELC